MWLLWLAAGCQEPFGTDRHDLVGFRIAAVQAPSASPGDEIEPSVALIVDGRAWSPDNVDLRWFWVAEAEDLIDLDPLSEPDAVGPEPLLVVPTDTRALGLIALRNGDERRAVIEVPAPPRALPEVASVSLSALPLQLSQLEGPELSVDARHDLEPTPASFVEEGQLARLQASLDGDPGDAVIRWMSTAGTWFELDPLVADWVPGDLLLDDDELDGEPTALGPGPVTVLALAVGAPGETAWRATDVWVGQPPAGVRIGGRWMAVEPAVAPAEGDAVRGVLTADDDAPTGFRLTGAALERAAAVTDWGTSALPCQVPRTGPFDPVWLLEGICPRDPLDGIEILLRPDVP
jgi:hypothetical protein